MVRSFVAVDLPQPVREVLEQVGEQLRREFPPESVRWTRIPSIHLTLKFLGDVPEGDIPKIKEALISVGQQHAPFTLSVAGVGCFPSLRRPRVVWVGVEEQSAALSALQRDVEDSLIPLGFKPEERSYHPHLTLARANRRISRGDQRSLGEAIADADVGRLIQFSVGSFRLMRSDLRPDGAVYTPLGEFPLGLKRET